MTRFETFQEAKIAAQQLPDTSIQESGKVYRDFCGWLKLWFQRKVIWWFSSSPLLKDDWLKIAEESDAYGYAVIS